MGEGVGANNVVVKITDTTCDIVRSNGSDTGLSNGVCRACYYSSGWLISYSCMQCPPHSSSSSGETSCTCNAGYQQSGIKGKLQCYAINETKYNMSLSDSSCSHCHLVSLASSSKGTYVYGFSNIPGFTSLGNVLFTSADFIYTSTNRYFLSTYTANEVSWPIMASAIAVISGDKGDIGTVVAYGGRPGILVAKCIGLCWNAGGFGGFRELTTSSEHFTSVIMSQDGRVIIAATTISDPYERIDKIYINSKLYSSDLPNLSRTRQIPLTVFTKVKSTNLLSYYYSYLNENINDKVLIGGLKGFVSSNGRSIYLSQESTAFLIISHDYGVTFQQSRSSIVCNSLDASDQGHVWCTTKSQHVHKSIDYGQTFIETRFLFTKISVSSNGMVLLGLDLYSNMHQSFDYGRTWNIFAGGATDFVFSKDNMRYVIQNKNALYSGYLTLPKFAKCEIGYYSSTGTGPECSKCPESSTNNDFGSKACIYCRNGYFGFNGKMPCYEYSGWLVHFLISLYTIMIFIASFLYTNRVRLFRTWPHKNEDKSDGKDLLLTVDSKEDAIDKDLQNITIKIGEEGKEFDNHDHDEISKKFA